MSPQRLLPQRERNQFSAKRPAGSPAALDNIGGGARAAVATTTAATTRLRTGKETGNNKSHRLAVDTFPLFLGGVCARGAELPVSGSGGAKMFSPIVVVLVLY